MGNFAENLNLGKRVLPLEMSEEASRAEFNVATPTSTTDAYSVRKFTNKTHFELLQYGFNVEPQRIFG